MIIFNASQMNMMMKNLNKNDEQIMIMFDESVEALLNEEMNLKAALELSQEYFLNMYL